jgi:hypothetical protein
MCICIQLRPPLPIDHPTVSLKLCAVALMHAALTVRALSAHVTNTNFYVTKVFAIQAVRVRCTTHVDSAMRLH